MNFLVLGRGKTGSLVAEAARERRHSVQSVGSSQNQGGEALTSEKLSEVDVVIDFTTPDCALENMEACLRSGKNMVVGTTGWYGELGRVRALVAEHKTGFVFGANFSVGVNLFFDIARTAAAALADGYSGQIFERHHVGKKDAPSGTAIALQRIIDDAGGHNLEITSFREGEVVGMHELTLESEADKIYLCHDAKSRRGFAEGAVRAAEWLEGKQGFFEFTDIWRKL